MSDGKVERAQPNGISVLISGAGVGECWRIGCTVRIFERTKHNIATGDSFSIGKSSLHFLKYWPRMQKQNPEIAQDLRVAYHDQTGKRVLGPMEFHELTSLETRERPMFRHVRPKFHNMLLEQLEEIGIQVEYDKEVVDYFEHEEKATAGVVLKDGSRHEADLVVAADGVRGASWSLVQGHPVPARSSGNAVFRVAYPVELAMRDPVVAERFKLGEDGRPIGEMWVGPGGTAAITRGVNQMEWVINHPDTGTAEESWSQKVDPAEVVKFTSTIPGWPEVANRLIMTAPADKIIDWKLMWRDPQPKWCSPGGRVVQLGDAAHTFLPSSGNGATQAIEDAISLSTCLSLASSKTSIPDATRTHNLLRFERVSCLQAFGVLNREKNTKKDGDMKSRVVHASKWILEHDPEKYALEKYEEALECVKTGKGFGNTNIPPGMIYRPWTIDGLLEAQRKGEPTVLDGDWD